MSDDVVKLSDYRRKKPDESDDKLCWVTFIGYPYMKGEKAETPRLTIEVPDGDYEAAISGVRDDGGFYVHGTVDTLFSPWPCAAVEVRHFYARAVPNVRPM